MSGKSNISSLRDAIMALTKELKRHNDANEPVTIRQREEPEYFRAIFDEKEREVRDTSEELSKLTPATGEAPTLRRRRSKEAPGTD